MASLSIEIIHLTPSTAQGNEITVANNIAVRNDKILKSGTEIHEILEREVKPTEITIEVVWEQERWGLK
jgi:exonuclease V